MTKDLVIIVEVLTKNVNGIKKRIWVMSKTRNLRVHISYIQYSKCPAGLQAGSEYFDARVVATRSLDK